MVSDVEPPGFDLEMVDVCVDAGDKAFFDVRVVGLPEPEVRWYVACDLVFLFDPTSPV